MIQKYTDIMIDLETLSTRADSVILSIGAVKFNKAGDQINDAAFYEAVSIDSNYAANMGQRHISEDTLTWWMKQPPEAQRVFFEPKNTLMSSLESLAGWICEEGDVDPDTVEVWGNGAAFDISILEHAYASKGKDAPWKFFNVRCLRTIRSMPFAKAIPKHAPTIAHNALHDALAQAVHLQAIWKLVKS